MDTEILVDIDRQIDDGERLLRQLARDQFVVVVAFWAKTSEEGLRYFYIASPAVDGKKPTEAFRAVYSSVANVPECGVSLSDIRIIPNTDPIAKDAVALRDLYPRRRPTRFHNVRLGNIVAIELWIYPRVLPLEVRASVDHHWQVLISEFDDLWLDCDTENDARLIASARVLEDEALGHVRTGLQFANELEATADVMEKYHMRFMSRRLRRRAQEVRQRHSTE